MWHGVVRKVSASSGLIRVHLEFFVFLEKLEGLLSGSS